MTSPTLSARAPGGEREVGDDALLLKGSGQGKSLPEVDTGLVAADALVLVSVMLPHVKDSQFGHSRYRTGSGLRLLSLGLVTLRLARFGPPVVCVCMCLLVCLHSHHKNRNPECAGISFTQEYNPINCY